MLYLLIFFFVCNNVFSAADIHFHDLKGHVITKATVGVPFGITCNVPEKIDATALLSVAKTFKGIQVKTHQARTMVSMINGVASHTTSITWVVTADECGVVSCGPSQIPGPHSKIAVPHKEIEIILDAPQTNNHDPLARFVIKDAPIFERQAVTFTLECTHPQHIEDIHIVLPEKYKRQFIFDEQHTQRYPVNQQQVKTVWYGYFFPEQSGVLIIPALAITYRTGISGFFFGFGSAKTETVYSNSVNMNVQPLPASQSIQAVGTFNALVSQLTGQGQETFVYKLSLETDNKGYLYNAQRPIIPAIDGIRIYEGKDSINNNIRTWEYLLQVIKPGTHVLEGADYTYFDVQQQCIKTLQPSAQTIEIDIPVNQSAQKVFVSYDEQQEQPSPTKIKPTGCWWYQLMMPMTIIYGNMILIMVLVLAVMIYRCLRHYFFIQQIVVLLYGYYLLVRAYRAASKKNISDVYTIMMAYLKIVFKLQYTPLKQELTQLLLSIAQVESGQVIVHLETVEQLLYAPVKEIDSALIKKIVKQFFSVLMHLVRKQPRKKAIDRFALLLLISFSLSGQLIPTAVEQIHALRGIQAISMPHRYYLIEQEIQEIKKQEGITTTLPKMDILREITAHILPPLVAQLMLLISMWGLFFAWLCNLSRRIKVILFCTLTLSFFSVCAYVYERGIQRAVVRNTTVDVHAGPNSTFEKIGSLVYLDEVSIKEHHDSWVKISHNAIYGWVPTEHLVLQESVV